MLPRIDSANLLFSYVEAGDVSKSQLLLNMNRHLAFTRNVDEDLPIHVACNDGFSGVVDLLVRCGSDVNATGCAARTPLICAALGGHFDCAVLVLKAGATIDDTDSMEENALHKAATRGDYRLLSLLLPNVSDKETINCQNVLGCTPLYLAMSRGHGECGRLLMQFGANPMIEDFFGNVPTLKPQRRPQLARLY